jgi:hypothetical protein
MAMVAPHHFGKKVQSNGEANGRYGADSSFGTISARITRARRRRVA